MQTMPQAPSLVKALIDLIQRQRSAFGQERVYQRGVALLLSELLAQGSHRTSDLLQGLGAEADDWTAWYRLFHYPSRFSPDKAAAALLKEVLTHVSAQELLVLGGDTTTVFRDSQRLEGTSWHKCPRNPAFKVGIHRAQRFFNGSWLTAQTNGYSRAIPLRFTPAFPEKAVTRLYPKQKEQAAALAFVHWVGQQLAAERPQQQLLYLLDGAYDRTDFWLGRPEHTCALVRTAKNRALKFLPTAYGGCGRRRTYGAAAPQDYLALKTGWQTLELTVRGQRRRMVYRVEGPFLRQGMATVPLMLICVRGQSWQRHGTRRKRSAVFYLVNAERGARGWTLPLPVETLLSWAWQRWELEVVHREAKSLFGLGDKQSFQPHAAVSTVQWSAWVYGSLMLAGYRTYGAAKALLRPAAWRRQPRRWTLTALLQRVRHELTTSAPFRATFSRSPHNWLEMHHLLLDPCFSSPCPRP